MATMYGKDNPSWKGGMVEVCCGHCLEMLVRRKSQLAKRKTGHSFCNSSCQMAWQLKQGEQHWNWKGATITCEQCGLVSKRSPSLITPNDRHFCDHECYGYWLSVYGESPKKDTNHDEIVEALIDFGANVLETHKIGGGFPDLIVEYNKVIHLIEIKYKRIRLNKNQIRFHKEWAGAPVKVVLSPDEALEYLTGYDSPADVPPF